MNKIKVLFLVILTMSCHCLIAQEVTENSPTLTIPTQQGLLTVSCNTVDTDSDQSDPTSSQPINRVYLSVQEIRNEGLLLVLDDGSEWGIQYFGGLWKLAGFGWTEQKNVSHWEVGDQIEVGFPSSGNLIDFVLVISNVSKKEEALTYLKQAPSVDHPACLWIVEIDNDNKNLILSDGTRWYKTTTNMYGSIVQWHKTAEIWEIGDPITLIKSPGGWGITESYLLWNHSLNEMPYVK